MVQKVCTGSDQNPSAIPVAIACGGELDGAIAQVPPPPTPSATPAPTPTPTPTCAKFTLFSRFESI